MLHGGLNSFPFSSSSGEACRSGGVSETEGAADVPSEDHGEAACESGGRTSSCPPQAGDRSVNGKGKVGCVGLITMLNVAHFPDN